MACLTTFLVLLIIPGFNCFINSGHFRYGVLLNVFSGRENPSWIVGSTHPLYTRMTIGLHRTGSTRLSEKLGYRGFTVEIRNMFGQRLMKTIGAGNKPRLELLLLNSSPYPMEPAVRRHIMSILRQRPHFHQSIISSSAFPPLSDNYNRDAATLRGICRRPRFNPEFWNFNPVQAKNNCYNYASNRRTNTFAQPGRASGRVIHGPTSAKNVLAATIRDGFILSPFLRRGTCYMALVIWPGVDFHFYRLDSNNRWSHKQGRTAAKNTDDSGNLITDPRRADRGNYSVFVGFLVVTKRAVVK